MNRYVVVDLETTGNVAKNGSDKITQFAAVVIEDGEIRERFSTFLNPQIPIPPFITELTGINDEMVQSAPLFHDIAPYVRNMLTNSTFVAHNVRFDLGFLQEELQMAGYPSLTCPMIDTVELARILFPTHDSYKLADLAKALKLTHDNPHRADSDALVTAQLLLQLMRKIENLPLVTLQSLYDLSRHLKSDISEMVSLFVLKKMENDEYTEKYDVFHNIALRKKSYAVTFDEQENILFPTFEENIDAHFQDTMNAYEVRQGQRTMMREVYQAFQNEQITLIEAGTGMGKTLAYLLPSIFHAKEAEKPVVISTQTVQLQQQILEKEIPLIRKTVPFPFEVALLKGRKHYLCLHKFEQALKEDDTNYDNILTKAKILVWLLKTETGDVDELNLPSGGRMLWGRICCDRNSTVGKKNVWSSRCFYEHAKNRVFFADLIITNHAMLFQDMYSDEPLLSYEYVVLDEAHHIEEVSSQVLGTQFSCMSFQLLLSRLGTLETSDLVSYLYDVMKKQGYECFPVFQKLDDMLKDIKFESDELFRMLQSFIVNKSERKNDRPNIKIQYRYKAEKENSKLWQAIIESTYRLDSLLQKVHIYFNEINSILHEHMDGIVHLEEFETITKSMHDMHKTLTSLLLQEQTDGVTWMEAETKGSLHSTVLYKQPTDVSSLLAQSFFMKRKSVIITSATLTVNGSFEYIKNALGLSKLHPNMLMIPSPFQYDKQVQMMIPTTVPNIKQVTAQEYVNSIAEHISSIANVMQGRMLVLFTSYEMLRETFQAVKEKGYLEEYALFAQGVNGSSRMRMTKHFRQFDKAILFGTSSFWEGIDMPGETLNCLVMVRLPFSPPDSPIMAAKAKELTKNGKNSFFELSLPQAVLRFKQGFGRLIRTKDDRGVFFVLDRRITTTYYGKRFISSIPAVPVYEQPIEELLHMLNTKK